MDKNMYPSTIAELDHCCGDIPKVVSCTESRWGTLPGQKCYELVTVCKCCGDVDYYKTGDIPGAR